MNAPGRRVFRLPVDPAGVTRLTPGVSRPPPGDATLLSGQAALFQLGTFSEAHARHVLGVCAAALSLYPAWERQSWMMPEPEAGLRAYGGHFLDLDAVARRLGRVRHVAGRQSYLHAPSGLTFAAHQSPTGDVTLLLGGVNSSHSEAQVPTVPAEVKQVEASLVNLMGRVPQLYRAADQLTLMMRDGFAGALGVSGHSLGGGVAQYAGLMNGLPVLAFSPTALGRGVLALLSQAGKLADPLKVLEQVRSFSLEGDPIPAIGTHRLRSRVVGLQLRLPLVAGIAPARHATSHGQIYSHLLTQLQQVWPQLPSALEPSEAQQE